MTAITPFDFGQYTIRTTTIGDAAWFSAADICAALSIKNHRDSLMHLDDDEKGVVSTDTPGGQQKISVVNESGLYALVLRSRKPEARKFAKWVTGEVLPSIRKTGSYGQPDADRMAHAMNLSTEAAQQVQRAVFTALMEGKPFDAVTGQWMLYLHQRSHKDSPDPHCRPLASNAICLAPDEYMDSLERGDGYRLSPEQWQRMLTLAMHRASRGGGLNTLCERMVGWIEAENGYPIHLFMPLWQAVNRRLEKRMNLPACQANAAVFQRGTTPGTLVPADSSKNTDLPTPIKRGQLSIHE